MSTTPSTHTHQTHSTSRTSHHTKAEDKGKEGGVSLCGPCVKSFEIAAERAEKKERERKGPKSWLERKFAVGFVIGLFGWSSYTFWGVILRKTWFRDEDALVGLSAGVVLTILYGFFALMFIITYLKIILTPPGYAKDHVQPSEPPLAPDPGPIPAYPHTGYNPPPSNTPYNEIYDGNVVDDPPRPSSPSHQTHDQDQGGEFVYPPSRKAPTSEYRRSMEDADRITHASLSLDDHGEFDDVEVAHSNTRLHTGGYDVSKGDDVGFGVGYEKMPVRPPPIHLRSRSGSNTAIPPNTPRPPPTPNNNNPAPSPPPAHQRSNSNTYPPTPLTPTSPSTPTGSGAGGKGKPALLRKSSKRGSKDGPPTPTHQGPVIDPAKTRPNKLVRAGSTSSRNTTSPTSPTTPTGFKPPMSPTSRSPTTPTGTSSAAAGAAGMGMASGSGMGFKYDSSPYILDPPRLSSQQTRTRSDSHTRTRSDAHTHMPTRSDPHTRTMSDSQPRDAVSPFEVPTPTIRTPTPGTTHDISGRPTTTTEHRRRPSSRPVPYLDDLPPIMHINASNSRYDRKPSEKPVLEPYYRYCSREGFVKPPRCHHCRICNTCVLGYDHHCPWVGGCVGAQNRKFFLVFLFWCTLYLVYTIALLIGIIVSRANPSRPVTFSSTSLDPNFVVLLIVSVLFLAFSAGMLGTHVHLLRHNASTVEWFTVQNMREREKAVVSQVVPVCECLGMGEGERGNGGLLGHKEGGWNDEELGEVKGSLPKGFRGRVALRKKWDSEWGRIGKEGNLWWLGSSRANWESVMGKNAWTWFLPVGNVTGVGVEYPRNPRFDEQGRWMKRSDWPEELR